MDRTIQAFRVEHCPEYDVWNVIAITQAGQFLYMEPFASEDEAWFEADRLDADLAGVPEDLDGEWKAIELTLESL